eukprot:8046398-Pyramimonas_sp.AAC.1
MRLLRKRSTDPSAVSDRHGKGGGSRLLGSGQQEDDVLEHVDFPELDHPFQVRTAWLLTASCAEAAMAVECYAECLGDGAEEIFETPLED